MAGAQNRDDLLEKLAGAIFDGTYPPGSFLPREIDICSTHQVSRSTARSALQTLVDTGILVRISGQGTRVRAPSEWQLLDPRVTHWLTHYTEASAFYMDDLLRFRESVEPFVTMEAATHATAEDLVAIERALGGMAATIDAPDHHSQGASHDEYDVAFHEAVYAATHNVIWTQLSHMLKPIIHAQVARTRRSVEAMRESVGCHRRVMEAIRRQERGEACEAARELLSHTAEDLRDGPGASLE
ncbi:FadR/GntR family transcriptional regulator [Larsenimonas salina]|uniref:FadR/GntR family transcriptional regulator n=1 Tax=Larsenimonas salina TaxID=1295565 RepID=UPI002074AAAB|nr:FCD domain-containing protein [Larsenimonas salina]MCM5704917.1 FCD domain-containing protein [Larsenimonas salina]